jgi:hypothetical protein
MKYDIHILFLLVVLGAFVRRITWKGWFGVWLFVAAWILVNWMKH